MADGFATRAIHAGRLPLPAEPPLATPIWQTSTFVFDDAEHYAHTLQQPREGWSPPAWYRGRAAGPT